MKMITGETFVNVMSHVPEYSDVKGDPFHSASEENNVKLLAIVVSRRKNKIINNDI